LASKILDATSFYAGIPFSSQETSFTTPLVFEEIKHIKIRQGAIDVLIQSNRLKIVEPQREFVDRVLQEANKTGDIQSLSDEDVSIIALCLQLSGELVTDDFAISNVAEHLNLKVNPVMTSGIAKVKDWIYFCSGCHKTFSGISHCPICGNKLARRLAKRKSSSNPIDK